MPHFQSEEKKQTAASFLVGLLLGSISTTAFIYKRRYRPGARRPSLPLPIPNNRNFKLVILGAVWYGGMMSLTLLAKKEQKKRFPPGQPDPVDQNCPQSKPESWHRLQQHQHQQQ